MKTTDTNVHSERLPAGLTEHDVQGDGISMHYAEYGAGTPVIWMHGSGPGASGISNFAGNVEEFADFRNLLFDHPRWGKSDKPAYDEGMISYSARNIIAAVENLGISRMHLIGNSYGGATAIRIAAERPDLVDRLVVMAGGARVPDEAPRPGMQILFRYMQLEAPTREDLHEFILAMLYDKSLFEEDLLEGRFQASLRSHPEIPVIPPNYGDLTPDLARVRATSLLLWGRDDQFISLERALLNVRGIENAELRIIPHCGHWVQYEAREYFNEAVGTFFRQAEVAAG